jgi:hypothetical protein
MAVDLSAYRSIQSNLFVRIDLSYTNEVLNFTDTRDTWDLTTGPGGANETYVGLGELMGVTATSSELRSTSREITITISGIPNTSITEIMNSRIKGSGCKIWRLIQDPNTRSPLYLSGRFSGIVTNYAINEEYDAGARTATSTVSIMCSGIVDVLANTTKGRRTNPQDQRFWAPTDAAFDRVPDLVGAYFDFGAKV